MNAQQWLEQVRKLDQLIDAKIAERDRLVALATDISAKPIDGMPYTNTGTVSQKMQNAVINLVELEKEINRLIDRYVDYKKRVCDLLEKLAVTEYGVLHRHYIRGMTWEKVAEDMGYSTMQIWRIKKKGLKNLEMLLNVMQNYDIM